jgi:hypothetical protein
MPNSFINAQRRSEPLSLWALIEAKSSQVAAELANNKVM